MQCYEDYPARAGMEDAEAKSKCLWVIIRTDAFAPSFVLRAFSIQNVKMRARSVEQSAVPTTASSSQGARPSGYLEANPGLEFWRRDEDELDGRHEAYAPASNAPLVWLLRISSFPMLLVCG